MPARSKPPQTCTASRSNLFAPLSDEPARHRLLLTALTLFAEEGYAKTSIRQIAAQAGANVAAVSYYFGSKAGLYKAVFFGDPAISNDAPAVPAVHELTALEDMYEHILAPLRSGELARYWIKLHRREMLEPTGIWQEKVDRGMQPMHAALVAYLCKRLGLAQADDEVRALAMMVVGPAVHLLVNCEVVDQLAPQLLEGPDAVDLWCARLARAADAMIEAERKRRRGKAVGRAVVIETPGVSSCAPPPRTNRSKA